MFAGKTLVDEKIFLIVPHGIAKIDRLDSPAVAFKLVDDHPPEVLFVDGIVRAESGSIVVIDNSLITMRSVVSAEVGNDFWNLTLKLDVERLNDIEPPPIGLPGDNSVDICIVVYTNANRRILINVGICITSKCLSALHSPLLNFSSRNSKSLALYLCPSRIDE